MNRLNRPHRTGRTVRKPQRHMESLEERRLFAVPTQTVFLDNFESGGAGWGVDTTLGIDPGRNPWQIGSSLAGGPGAFQGTKYAGTTRAGNDAYFTSPAIQLPAVNKYTETLTVRFDSYTKYGSNFGVPTVEARYWVPELNDWSSWVSVDPTSPTLPQNSNSWSWYGMNLLPFNGQKIQLGFHQYGLGQGGWFIDEVWVTREQCPVGTPGDENFEGGFNGWYTERGEFLVGTPTLGAQNGASGKVAGTTVDGTGLSGSGASILWSPPFRKPTIGSGQKWLLTFDQYKDFGSAGGFVSLVYSQFFPVTNTWGPSETFIPAMQLPNKQWSRQTIDITQLAQTTAPIRIGFDVEGLSGPGWHVDNIKFTGPGITPPAAPEVDVNLTGTSTTVVDGGAGSIGFGSPVQNAAAVTKSFTIKNSGTATLTLGQVKLANNSGFSVVTQPATSLAPGKTTTFSLRMATNAVGSKSADVSFTNNDANENPFNFKVTGLVKGATFAGLVFRDSNGDKTRQSTESALSGWTVLLDTDTNNDGVWELAKKSVTTGSNGTFSFADLAAGKYRFRLVNKSGFTITTPSGGNFVTTLGAGVTVNNKLFGVKPV